MVLLAGQDGCQTNTIQLDGDEITVDTEFEGDLTCQAFTEDNKHFLAISNGDDIFQYWAFPGEMIHELDIEDIIDEDEEYNMGYTLFHIKGKLFVINFTERYYIYDADKNEIVDELIVDGHEPRPTHEIYPSLDDDTLITDIEYMDEVHDIIVLHTTRAKNREVSYFRKADLAKLF